MRLDFPVVTIRDMVRAQAALIDRLGIESLFCVAGGSMGGMQVLQWAASYPGPGLRRHADRRAARHSAQNIAFHEVGRQAVMADPDWRGGATSTRATRPSKGLAVARMGAHITYLSEMALHRKFGRNLQDRGAPTFSFDADFQIESYLRYQGIAFVERFDANSYLYVTRAMDYFDLAAEHGGVLAKAFRGTQTRFCVISFTSDWLFPTSDSRAIVHALNAAAASGRLRRDRERQGPRRLPARRARDVRRGARGFIDAAARGSREESHDASASHPTPARRPTDSEPATPRLPPRRRHGRAGLARARRRLRRRLAAGAPARPPRRRRARHRDLARGRQRCLAKGLPVIQGDADTDLADYPDDAFDYVILSQTIQATRQPRVVLEHLLRIGRRAIVSFPNFGHWRVRARPRSPRPHAGDREPALFLVRHPQHPFLHHPRFRRAVPRGRAPRWNRPSPSMPAASPCASPCPGGCGTCSASRRCSCCGG